MSLLLMQLSGCVLVYEALELVISQRQNDLSSHVIILYFPAAVIKTLTKTHVWKGGNFSLQVMVHY